MFHFFVKAKNIKLHESHIGRKNRYYFQIAKSLKDVYLRLWKKIGLKNGLTPRIIIPYINIEITKRQSNLLKI